MKDVIEEFDMSCWRRKWQICEILWVGIVVWIGEVCNMGGGMWGGIGGMWVILGFMEDME